MQKAKTKTTTETNKKKQKKHTHFEVPLGTVLDKSHKLSHSTHSEVKKSKSVLSSPMPCKVLLIISRMSLSFEEHMLSLHTMGKKQIKNTPQKFPPNKRLQ